MDRHSVSRRRSAVSNSTMNPAARSPGDVKLSELFRLLYCVGVVA
jgi:hypothetical protein